MKTENESDRILLFASVPKKEELCNITVRASFSPDDEKFGPCNKSAYHCQILKCRQLIFYVPDIIASPVFGSYSNIHIITTVQYYESGKLSQYLEKLRLTASNATPVTNSVYEACLRYTLIAVLAPSWNQVGEYLIQGREFLTCSTPMNTVKLDVAVTDDEVVLVLWPARARLPLLKLEDFNVSSNLEQNFFTPGCSAQKEICLESQWIHVLPSQKKGRVMSVSRDLPLGCFFDNYRHMRQHWKNLYGYRLPESDEDIIYYSVYFQPLGPTLYTYPSICVRPTALLFLKCTDNFHVLQNFLADIRQKIPSICGKPFGVDYKVGYAVPKHWKCGETLVKMETFAPALPRKEVSAAIKPEFIKPIFLHVQELKTMADKDEIDRQKLEDHRTGKRSNPATVYGSASLVQPRYEPIFKPAEAKRNCQPPDSDLSALTPSPAFGSSSDVSMGSDSALSNGGIPKHVNGSNYMVPFKFISHKIERSPVTGALNMKRSAQMTPASAVYSSCKKPRSRPQVQTDVDVEALARNQDLIKVNTATLVNWLRCQMVPCKVKDKKSDLVNKVMKHLNLEK